MNLEKIRLFVLIVILVGGLGASPVFQQGAIGQAFAQSDDATDVASTDASTVDSIEVKEIEDDETDVDEIKDDKTEDDRAEYKEKRMDERPDLKEEYDKRHMDTKRDLMAKLERFCDMTDAEQDELLAKYDFLREHHERIANYCAMTDEERKDFRHDLKKKYDERYMDAKSMDAKPMDAKLDLKKKLARYCEMSEEERKEFTVMRDKMTDEMRDKMTDEMRDRVSKYCDMTDEERNEYRDTHRDMMMDFKDRFGVPLDRPMKGDLDATRLVAAGLVKHPDISDERKQALIAKFKEHRSDLTDEQRKGLHDKIKVKYTDHFKMKFKAKHDALSDQQKDDLLARIAEMRAHKAELRDRSQDMTDDERKQFKTDFREKAHDKRLAWISPHKQMIAGIDVSEIECREGLDLVIKNSNGRAMCLKASTAEKMIERGLALPAV